ncbi:hypothetical protein GCM10011383_24680 [Hymenobacter cavernae]|uniref:Uncharacterized protein n=1 Tax=Hymenobacter cavernae TaxID=2044852 RepID=A0ABQ1U843_9BACT|nr:hypothetical protein GCM10011383_24680 [Hymenobacter cavernae]
MAMGTVLVKRSSTLFTRSPATCRKASAKRLTAYRKSTKPLTPSKMMDNKEEAIRTEHAAFAARTSSNVAAKLGGTPPP